jgi:hypothetical protein
MAIQAGDIVLYGNERVKVLSLTKTDAGEVPIINANKFGSWAPLSELRESASTVVTIAGKQVTVEHPAAGETVTRAIWPTP